MHRCLASSDDHDVTKPQEVKDSLRIENDYIIDLQSIVLLEELHKEMKALKKEQKRLVEFLEKSMSK
jgi:uncharacterized membrane protein